MVDKIMENNPVDPTESPDEYYLYSVDRLPAHSLPAHSLLAQQGGAPTDMVSRTPTGGFPPIYIVDSVEQNIEKSKNRQLIRKTQNSISIKDILQKKKTPV